jgi:signal transduction histidine kinase
MLVIFGIGLIKEAGTLPQWLQFAPIVLIVPLSLLLSYALIISITEPPLAVAMDVWSRYLLYFPGCVLSAFGFLRQWKRLATGRLREQRTPLLGAASGFMLNAVVAGLIVPATAFGLASWLNYTTVEAALGIPIQILRAGTALLVTISVINSLRVFEAERQMALEQSEQDRLQARQAYLQAQEQARQEAESWTEALVEINRWVVNLGDLDQVLQRIVQAAQRLLQADSAVLALWDEGCRNLLVKAFAVNENMVPTQAEPVTRQFILEAVRRGEVFRYPQDVFETQESWSCPVLEAEVQAACIVPLQLDQQSIGGLWVGRARPESFSHTDASGLMRLADQAVIAIEHSILAAQMQSVAVLEERNRIAREMHDSLSQILGYLSLETQTLEALARQEDREALLQELQQARRNINAAQADVRENILSLRTTLSGEAGLIPALQAYVTEFGLQHGLEACLEVETSNSVHLSPLAEVQVVRIVQEALTNVRKHARASQVRVQLGCRDGILAVTITDNGQGFEPPVPNGHFGLLTMRERAESVAGGLTVTSSPGEGTQVNMWLPVQG